MSSHRRLLLSYALAAVLAGQTLAGAVIHVDADAMGAANGVSWSDAFTDLTDALSVALAGDELRLAEGSYPPGASAMLRFDVPAGVTLRGGFAGAGALQPDEQDPVVFLTVLDGDLNQDDVPFDQSVNRADNVSTVVMISAGELPVRFDGLTVRGARSASGVHVTGATVAFTRCRFEDNRGGLGGGMRVEAGGDVSLDDCVFDRNVVGSSGSSVGTGGGLLVRASVLSATDTVFSGNRAQGPASFPGARLAGGAALGSTSLGPVTARLERCTFVGNFSNAFGGGLVANGDVVIVDTAFVGNALGSGSAPFGSVGGSAASLVDGVRLQGCRILGNTVGGAVQIAGDDCALVDCEIVGNGALDTVSPAVSLVQSEGSEISSCTIAGNLSLLGTAGLELGFATVGLSVSNTLVWGNRSGLAGGQEAQLSAAPGAASFDHCSVEDWSGALGGLGNLAADPLFVDLDGPDDLLGTLDDDARLGLLSAAIDAGSLLALSADVTDLDCDGDLAEPTPLDLDGRVRAFDDPAVSDTGVGSPALDIGAYERGAGLPTDIWSDLGGASAGAAGPPLLLGSGTFCEGQLVALELSGAMPNGLALLLESLTDTPLPKWGGVLHSVPVHAQFLVNADSSGALRIEVPLPLSLPPGLTLHYQYLVHDTSLSPAIALSNAVRALTP